ncbi:protein TRIGALACTOSYLDIACYLGLYCEROL 5, chloroplastic-like [Phragmites australis]|uniref:protein TRIGALACTOSYLDIACYLGLYCEROL 5, chloroplastic-like n=1 Tax=Phragmites australis TaxID=29695 RepID=UPI002D769313|nr:protein TRIGALACTOSYLDIACYLGLYCEROL 5, chloroplastic-like [Phragmites australis]
MPGGRRRGPLWRLPAARSGALGKLGPAFGIGAGCGVGVGVGLIGAAGTGAGFPGLQLGFGAGAGCGIGIGFGYGFGKGIAYDEKGRYSNIRRSFRNSRILPADEEFDILFDELMESTRKLIKATSKEIDKWRRM